jgi:NAD(P)-dependent dehydrogenase (short-subunit alcohol dehydrogenase family)
MLGEVRFLSSTVGKLPVAGQKFQSGKRPTMTKTLITGASQGLGLHTARRLVAQGHEVWVTARDPKVGAEAARESGAHFVQLDVTDDASVLAASQAVAKGGGVDVIINNAGSRTARQCRAQTPTPSKESSIRTS